MSLDQEKSSSSKTEETEKRLKLTWLVSMKEAPNCTMSAKLETKLGAIPTSTAEETTNALKKFKISSLVVPMDVSTNKVAASA